MSRFISINMNLGTAKMTYIVKQREYVSITCRPCKCVIVKKEKKKGKLYIYLLIRVKKTIFTT